MSDSTVNVVKQSFLFQIYETERIADVVAPVIDQLRVSAKLTQLFLQGIALQNGTIIVIVVEGDNTYSFFAHKFTSCLLWQPLFLFL